MPPIFMDRHDVPGVTAKDVAEVHQEDLKIQDKYGCRALTYWFDEERATAFCLIEAPDKDSVRKMHDQAHGLVPNQLIEVNSDIVEAFLGRITDPTTDKTGDTDLTVFNDPAFRTVMAIDLKDAALLNTKLGAAGTIQFSGVYTDLIRKALQQYDGREVEQGGMVFLASFVSVSQAVLCAIEIQQRFQHTISTVSAHKTHIQIGLSAGVPVTESNEFFGPTVQLAKRLCAIAGNGQVLLASEVKSLYNHQAINDFENRNTIKALSLPEENFLNRLMDITRKSWQEASFGIHDLARQLGVSKSQLYRKTLALTGLSPNDFIKEFRLHEALKLIENQQGNISEIAYQTGFASPSYFSKCFSKRFNILPSDCATAIANPLFS